ncbi:MULTISPECIES: helix-turn-helix domain-containing protein [unclassified Nonomuraea]|uniref:ArsR/SmtB family transcription factor n=1 Tax=unclassified Nonomuraea TaxID=2593643 RepID=UPI0033F9F7E4
MVGPGVEVGPQPRGDLPFVAPGHDGVGQPVDPVRRRIVRELAGEPDWARACGTFAHLPVAKSTLSHHFGVLRQVGLLEQRDEGTRRLNRLRRAEFDERFPGLLALVVEEPEGA